MNGECQTSPEFAVECNHVGAGGVRLSIGAPQDVRVLPQTGRQAAAEISEPVHQYCVHCELKSLAEKQRK